MELILNFHILHFKTSNVAQQPGSARIFKNRRKQNKTSINLLTH